MNNLNFTCKICYKKIHVKPSKLKTKRSCSRSCSYKWITRKHGHSLHWKGGKTFRKGYMYIYLPEHPHSDVNGYFLEHRNVVEKNIGRYLLRTEIVHHINGIKNDNRLENLKILSSQSEHAKEHLIPGKEGFQKHQKTAPFLMQ